MFRPADTAGWPYHTPRDMRESFFYRSSEVHRQRTLEPRDTPRTAQLMVYESKGMIPTPLSVATVGEDEDVTMRCVSCAGARACVRALRNSTMMLYQSARAVQCNSCVWFSFCESIWQTPLCSPCA